MVSDSDLYGAMLQWTQTATENLSEILSDISIVGLGGTGWAYNQEGRLVFGLRSPHFKPWLIEKLLYENEAWQTLEKMSLLHTRMTLHCDTPVGTPYYGASQRSAREFCYGLLPRPSIDGSCISLEGFEKTAVRITELIDEFNASQIVMKTVWPVCGMRSSQPIYLNDEQCFRSLTAEEKLSALNFKMIEVDEGQTTLDPSLTDWSGFILSERLDKCFGHHDTPDDLWKSTIGVKSALNCFCLSRPLLVKSLHITVAVIPTLRISLRLDC